MATTTAASTAIDPLDYLDVDALLDDEERAIRDTVRRFVRERVLPEVGDWFEKGVFPRELFGELAKLGLLGMHLEGYGLPGASSVAYGIVCALGIYTHLTMSFVVCGHLVWYLRRAPRISLTDRGLVHGFGLCALLALLAYAPILPQVLAVNSTEGREPTHVETTAAWASVCSWCHPSWSGSAGASLCVRRGARARAPRSSSRAEACSNETRRAIGREADDLRRG